ncbi:30S ribosomal protein S6--L-glutamate ligase [Coralloluteibacterium stylophorae]|uniref:Probable alpha-L-glutamate ligase n=1 Tax=Coralloluteibacterium stylophorae TaxID=1776034 RepID=A0A8J8AX18_9GAMM|nr:30S ribosomal protein S6--L-glutamate ligase [Coralloluteibacterium stylophorae]MBS7458280.1 30S ribosomal protein S6--L-glutamate ligase [Coralloluteibacterium stylophorae]
MKLAILSRNTKLVSTQRLVEAARARGHTVRVLDPLRCYMHIAPGRFQLNYKGKPLADFDAVLPRIGASVTRYGTAVLRQFELMGVYTPNPSDAVLRARDKLRCHQLLAAQGIDLPLTVFGDNPDDTADLLQLLGEPPHVIKLTEGTQGAGVILTERNSSSKSVIEALRGLYANFLVQEFIAEADGSDLRCFVVGDRVVAAMRRRAPAGDFRSNLHRGGSAEPVELDAAEVETALRAAQVLGLGVAGVDMLRSRRGPLVLEVNASPGLEGIEAATGVDVAGAVVDYLAAGCPGTRRGAPRPRRRSASPVLNGSDPSP